MKNLKDIIEGLKIGSNTKIKYNKYTYKPKTFRELRYIIEERLKKDKNADLNDIDVSDITDMNSLFDLLDPHNIDISEWDVSNVTNMSDMFYKCKNFNSNLSNWKVSKVIDMGYMFYECKKFNSDLSKWDVSSVKNMWSIFYECDSLKNKPSWYKE